MRKIRKQGFEEEREWRRKGEGAGEGMEEKETRIRSNIF